MNNTKQLNMIFMKGASLKKLEEQSKQLPLGLAFRFEQDAKRGQGIKHPVTAFEGAAA